MITYIKNTTKNKYITLENELDPDLYNNIGLTYEDYLNGMFVALNEDLLEFLNENPRASVEEVYYCLLKLENISIEKIKEDKLLEIEAYDSSSNVNEFYYNEIPFWIDKATRVGLVNSTLILINTGIEETTLWLGNFNITLSCNKILQMLSALEIYALECYNVTALHKNEINNLDSIGDIINYNITLGYPEKLKFE